jgi:hypothetical protein
VTLQKYFSHPRLVIYCFFPTPHIKLKLGQQTGGRLVVATHIDQSNYLINQSINQQQVLCSAMPFTSLSIMLWKNAGPKPFW